METFIYKHHGGHYLTRVGLAQAHPSIGQKLVFYVWLIIIHQVMGTCKLTGRHRPKQYTTSVITWFWFQKTEY